MVRICVLGGGLVGRFIAFNLASKGHEIRLIDADEGVLENLPNRIQGIQSRIDVSQKLDDLIGEAAVVVNCLPGRFGHKIRKSLISIKGIMVADLAFTSEDPRELDILAKNNGSLLIYDIGIAPGMSNILIGKVQNDASKVDRVRIWVGGNPQKPDADWSYMAPFSPSDVIEEYTRPARIRRGGKNIAAPALTERHSVQVTGYGEMEAFLTDGLRSLLDTILCDDLAEYTVRWPGHIQRYIDLDPINEEELIESWKFNSTRPEFTWLAVEIHADGEMHRWEIIDEGQGGWSSMARTTGLVTIEVVEMMIEGVFTQFGVLPPEALHEHADRFIAMMKGNGVKIINNHSSSSE